ncbi:AMP-binding protein [Candidatus Chloroploca sp. M-50]|uniref:AMP-binding protein n=1 Tax=Candidatus Chloroploca mongolica TaxID=2528176 RepID=A0ABS4D488_9CHLR|nr:AMP-binding protein [Candidatus Chloroploca mongolica]MBP1464241.1 AMP-binding protein [Candidatus Chloroploca mongolica]
MWNVASLRLCVFASLRQAVEEEDGMRRETMTTPSSLVEALRAHVECHPQRDALIFIGSNDSVETIAYGQLDLDARRYAGLLQANDVQPGDLVIVAFEHRYALVAAFWGGTLRGGRADHLPVPRCNR